MPALDASAILAVGVAAVVAGGCTWVDSCFRLRGFNMFGRRFVTYLAAALATTLARSTVQRYGGLPAGVVPLDVGWAAAAEASLLARRIAAGRGRPRRPAWLTPIPGLEPLLSRVLDRMDRYDNDRDSFRLDRRLWRWSRRLYGALGPRAAGQLLQDYQLHLLAHHPPHERARYRVHNISRIGHLHTADGVYRLLAEIVAAGDRDYTKTLPSRVRALCRRSSE